MAGARGVRRRPGARFRTFFLSLVHHRAVDAVRREERLRKRADRAANLEPATDEDVAEDVVEGAYLAVRRKEVREALAILPPEQRQVIELAYFGGMTQTRIAERARHPGRHREDQDARRDAQAASSTAGRT